MRRPRLRRSLTFNAASLMTATIVTNGLGLAFWAEAARLRSPVVVGRAAAAVAALTLLATISQLNLTNVFLRLLPGAGRLGRPLIAWGYLAVVALALVIGVAYGISGLSSSVVTGGWFAHVVFALAVAVLAVFALQDSVLVSLRLAPWVTVENISFASGKLVLLPLLVLLPTGGGIAVSWVLPAAVAVLAISLLLFRRVLPSLQTVDGTLPGRRRLLSFVAGEYAGNICATASVQLMPLIVVSQLGPGAVAYFTLPWLISMGITVLIWNVGSSFMVEVGGGHGRPATLLRRSLLLWGAIVVGALTVCVLGAHPLLELAGSRYAAHGSTLLRLVGLSVPFSTITAVYCTLAWLDRRVWWLALYQAISAAALLGTTLLLMPHLGLVAVGWANLGVQAAAAMVAGPLTVKRLRLGELVGAR